MIFIDNSNIFRGSCREGIKFDYQKLVDFLADSGIQRLEKYDLTRVIMYCAVDRSQPDDRVRAQEALYSIFNSFIKFDVKTFDLKLVQAANGDITDPGPGRAGARWRESRTVPLAVERRRRWTLVVARAQA